MINCNVPMLVFNDSAALMLNVLMSVIGAWVLPSVLRL